MGGGGQEYLASFDKPRFPIFSPLLFSLTFASFGADVNTDEDRLEAGRPLRRWLATIFSVQRPRSFSILSRRRLPFQVAAYDGSRQIADFGGGRSPGLERLVKFLSRL